MFFLSLSLIFVLGSLGGFLFQKIRLPALIWYLMLGILLAYGGLIDSRLLDLSSEIRKLALMIILLKAGLSLNLDSLKKVGRPAILMSFLPAVAEMCIVGAVAPSFFPITYVESFILGAVLGAVSPAVVVPRMARLFDEGYGVDKGIPELITAGSSLDDIVMIVFFNAFMGIEKGGSFSYLSVLNIPLSIVSGILVGVLLGLLLSFFFEKVHIRDSLKLVILIGVGAGLVYLEDFLATWFSYSSLLSIVVIGMVILLRRKAAAKRLVVRTEKMWCVAEIFLFVLVGASVKVEYFGKCLLMSLALLAVSLTVRSLAVQSCLIKTRLNMKERTYVAISYLPKATVQATLGGILLDYGNSSGSESAILAGTIVLSVSVVAILITAPLSAFAMDFSYKKLLSPRGEAIVKSAPLN